MTKLIDITQRSYDNKWIQWELMDSKKIGQTSTWNRYKWVITNVWEKIPREYLKRLANSDPNFKIMRRENDVPIYTFKL